MSIFFFVALLIYTFNYILILTRRWTVCLMLTPLRYANKFFSNFSVYASAFRSGKLNSFGFVPPLLLPASLNHISNLSNLPIYICILAILCYVSHISIEATPTIHRDLAKRRQDQTPCILGVYLMGHLTIMGTRQAPEAGNWRNCKYIKHAKEIEINGNKKCFIWAIHLSSLDNLYRLYICIYEYIIVN